MENNNFEIDDCDCPEGHRMLDVRASEENSERARLKHIEVKLPVVDIRVLLLRVDEPWLDENGERVEFMPWE